MKGKLWLPRVGLEGGRTEGENEVEEEGGWGTSPTCFIQGSNRQFALLPYMKGIIEHLQRAFNKHDIRLYSEAGYSIRNAVVSQMTLLKNMSSAE